MKKEGSIFSRINLSDVVHSYPDDFHFFLNPSYLHCLADMAVSVQLSVVDSGCRLLEQISKSKLQVPQLNQTQNTILITVYCRRYFSLLWITYNNMFRQQCCGSGFIESKICPFWIRIRYIVIVSA